MIFPIEQHSTIELKDKGISSTSYILNLIENAMEDSRLTLIKRSESKLKYAKTDMFKYPHPRNFLHNLSFNVKTAPTVIEIKMSSKNWELIALGFIFLILLVVDNRMRIVELIPIFIVLMLMMIGVKQYLLNLIKSNLTTIINEL